MDSFHKELKSWKTEPINSTNVFDLSITELDCLTSMFVCARVVGRGVCVCVCEVDK